MDQIVAAGIKSAPEWAWHGYLAGGTRDLLGFVDIMLELYRFGRLRNQGHSTIR